MVPLLRIGKNGTKKKGDNDGYSFHFELSDGDGTIVRAPPWECIRVKKGFPFGNPFLLLVSVKVCFVRTIHGNADVVGLLLGELRELNPNLAEVQASNFFVEMLRQVVNAYFVVLLP